MDTFQTFIAPRLFVTGETRPAFQDFSWDYLIASSGKYVLMLSFLGLFLGFIQGKRFAPVIVLWVIMMFSIANLQSIPLPGRGLINNTSVLIFLFIPISAGGGYLIDQSITFPKIFIPGKRKKYCHIFLTLSVLVITVVSVRNILPILNLQTALLRKADLQGMKWISKNVPADEVILINYFPWAYGLYAGSDGGYWISPITQRQTIPPPLLYGFDRVSEERLDINTFLHHVSSIKDQPDKLFDLLTKENIKYIYIGARGGLLSPQNLLRSEKYDPLYEYKGTWVFKLVPENAN
jgi:hypothetical protein